MQEETEGEDNGTKGTSGNELGNGASSSHRSGDTEVLINHMNALMKTTESSLMEAIKDNKEELTVSMKKMEKKMEGKMSLINNSLSEMRSNISKLEKNVGDKIDRLKDHVGDIEEKLKTVEQNAEQFQESVTKENTQLKTELSQLKEEIDRERESNSIQLNELKDKIGALTLMQTPPDGNYPQRDQHWKDRVDTELLKLASSIQNNKHEIDNGVKQLEKIDNKTRCRNITIDGVDEKQKQNKKGKKPPSTGDKEIETQEPGEATATVAAVEAGGNMTDGDNPDQTLTNEGDKSADETMDKLINLVVDMIQPVIGNSTQANVISAYRVGVARGKKPRQIMVILDDEKTRTRVLGKVPDIKKLSNNKYLWINRDQNENTRRKYSLIKSCFKLLKENGHPCSLKGAVISLNGKPFDYDKLNLLPEGCRPENVKSKILDDGMSIAFASEHSYCSNFAPAPIKYKGRLYTSAEHAYQATKARMSGYKKLADAIRDIHNPYYVKKLSVGIDKADEWDAMSEEIMEEIMREKFTQNPHLMERLTESTYSDFYEMTTDKKWGTGMKIMGNKPIDPRLFKGKNVTGQILRKLKNQFTEGITPSVSGSGSGSEDGESDGEETGAEEQAEVDLECTD